MTKDKQITIFTITYKMNHGHGRTTGRSSVLLIDKRDFAAQK